MALTARVWTTVDELKVYLGITITDFDAVLEDILNQATDMIERELGRSILDTGSDITEIQDGDPENEGRYIIQVENYPINAFTSLAFNQGTPSTPNWVVEDVDNYERDDELGQLYMARQANPFARPIPRGRRNVRIIYQGGYTNPGTLKNDIILALHMSAAKIYNRRRSQGLIKEQIGTAEIDWTPEMENELQQILATYRTYFE